MQGRNEEAAAQEAKEVGGGEQRVKGLRSSHKRGDGVKKFHGQKKEGASKGGEEGEKGK